MGRKERTKQRRGNKVEAAVEQGEKGFEKCKGVQEDDGAGPSLNRRRRATTGMADGGEDQGKFSIDVSLDGGKRQTLVCGREVKSRIQWESGTRPSSTGFEMPAIRYVVVVRRERNVVEEDEDGVDELMESTEGRQAPFRAERGIWTEHVGHCNADTGSKVI